MVKLMYAFSSALHWLVGVGAAAGGMRAVLNPLSPMGFSTNALKVGPFKTFLIPGLFLAIVLGLFNIVAGFYSVKRMKYSEALSGTMGIILVVWIAVQCVILQTIYYLHVIFFAIGAIQALLALIMVFKYKVFPYGIIARVLGLSE